VNRSLRFVLSVAILASLASVLMAAPTSPWPTPVPQIAVSAPTSPWPTPVPQIAVTAPTSPWPTPVPQVHLV
jgi:hypothetical protein